MLAARDPARACEADPSLGKGHDDFTPRARAARPKGFMIDPPVGDPPDFEEGQLPPDPDEPPAVELWSAVGNIPAWGTLLLLLSWSAVFAVLVLRRQID